MYQSELAASALVSPSDVVIHSILAGSVVVDTSVNFYSATAKRDAFRVLVDESPTTILAKMEPIYGKASFSDLRVRNCQ